MQTVFRHKPRSKRATAGKASRSFHSRKPHTKSRRGCDACKQKRIRCNELKPVCTSCQADLTACVYGKHGESVVQTISPTQDAASMSIQMLKEQIRDALGTIKLSNDDVYNALHGFQHFNITTAQHLGMKKNYGVLTSCVMQGVWSRPPMMHLVLALASVHQRQLRFQCKPGEREAVHWQIALRGYRQELDTSRNGVYGPDLDAVITSTYLLTVVGFCIDEELPIDLFLHYDADAIAMAFAPLSSAGSLLSVMRVLPHAQHDSTWRIVLDAFARSGRSLPLETCPAAFISVCELQPDIRLQQDLYYRMLCHIVPILESPPCTRQIARLFAMIGNLWVDLQPMVVVKDAKSLLLLAWWFALLCRLDVWWLQARARSSCRAIVAYLRTVDKGITPRLLEYPSSLGQSDISWLWSEPIGDSGETDCSTTTCGPRRQSWPASMIEHDGRLP